MAQPAGTSPHVIPPPDPLEILTVLPYERANNRLK